MNGQLLSIQNLCVRFNTYDGVVDVLDDVSFSLTSGKWTGLVGETGCGKSVTASAIIRLLPESAEVSGKVLFKGQDLLKESEKTLRTIRGSAISMVFQDPSISINPALKIGHQIEETIRVHQGIDRKKARQSSAAIVDQVGLESYVLRQYAHELSGGMVQRVMIGLAVSCNPDLILADEPTSALDVTIQREILVLMKDLGSRFQTAILLITHDLVLVAQTCDDVIVMYAGTVAERGPVDAVLRESCHPYTLALVNAIPTIDQKKDFLEEIEGNVPDLLIRPQGCPFEPRCTKRIKGLCETTKPAETQVGIGHFVRCHLWRGG
jgi:peptide/nickel transport system ATP-binding protein